MLAAGPSGWEIITAIATILAAVAAAVAAGASASAARSYRAIAKRDEDRREEERRSRLEAQVVGAYMYDKDRFWLQIENHGPSVASTVRLTAEPLPRSLELEQLPDELAPGTPIVLHYVQMPGTTKPTTIIRWVDGCGDPHSFNVHPNPVTIAAGKTASERMRELRRQALDFGR